MEKQEINRIMECCQKMQEQRPNLEELAVFLGEDDPDNIAEDLVNAHFLLSECVLNNPHVADLELLSIYFTLKRLYQVFKAMQTPSVTNLCLTCNKPLFERY